MPIELDDIRSGYNLSKINSNFQRIEDAWDEKLDRLVNDQGNQMEQDIDMNSYRLINYPPTRTEVPTDLVRVDAISDFGDFTGQIPEYLGYTGDGITTDFQSPVAALRDNKLLQVYVGGLRQQPTRDYFINGSNVRFTTAPVLGVAVDIYAYNPAGVIDGVPVDVTNSLVIADGSVEPRRLGARFSDTLNLLDWGGVADGVTNNANIILEMLASKPEEVHIEIIIPNAEDMYVISALTINRGNFTIRGVGRPTITYSPTGTNRIMRVGDIDRATHYENIEITGLRFYKEDRVELPLPSIPEEFMSMLSIGFVKNMRVHNNDFIGPQGDAIAIARNTSATTNLIPEDIHIYNNFVDGVDKKNRNGVSVISGKNVQIRDNTFTRLSSPLMPGAIDIEANDYASDIIQEVLITNNTIYQSRCASGAISVIMPENTTTGGNFIIADNIINSDGLGTDATGINIIGVGDNNKNRLSITGNITRNTNRGFRVLGNFNAPGTNSTFIIANNIFTQSGDYCYLGFETTDKVFDVSITDNTFVSNQGALAYSVADNLLIANNIFKCDDPAFTGFNIFARGTGTTSTNVHIKDNIFNCPVNSYTVFENSNDGHDSFNCSYTGNAGNCKRVQMHVAQRDYAEVPGDTNWLAFNGDTPITDFPAGRSIQAFNGGGVGLPAGQTQGVLIVDKWINSTDSSSFLRWNNRTFYTASNVTDSDSFWTSKWDSNSNDWSAWVKHTGV